MSSILKFIIAFILVCQSWPALANSAPPGLSFYLSDDQGWFGSLDRVGTAGTMWDQPTVMFTGQLTRRPDGASVETEIEFYLNMSGRMFMIRHDRVASSDNPVRVCTYTGFTDNIPFDDGLDIGFMFNDDAFKKVPTEIPEDPSNNIGGNFFCSDMDKFGAWFGKRH